VGKAIERPVHGGDLESVIRSHIGATAWLDFSANINPAGPPPAVMDALRAASGDPNVLTQYPTAYDRALTRELARHHACEEAQVVVANGASALIEAFVRCVAPRRCLVPQPAFSEYARALAAQGCKIVRFPLDPEADFQLDVDALIGTLERERPEACIITNPHNPSGTAATQTDMRRLLACVNALGIALLLDEAFVDFAPTYSIAHDVLATGGQVFVLRSLTKFYAIPGLRVGFGLAPAPFAGAIASRVPSWSITALAAIAAIAALGDEDFAQRTRATTVRSREHFTALLPPSVRAIPSVANFLMLVVPGTSTDLTGRLCSKHQIVVRDCASYETLAGGPFIRVAVRSDEDNARFAGILAHELKGPISGHKQS